MMSWLNKISLMILVLAAAFLNTVAIAQDSVSLHNLQPMLRQFVDVANPKTGLTMSFLGGKSAITMMGASTYDMSLWAMATSFGRRVISTYAKNSTWAHDQNNVQTSSKGYAPEGGVLSFIRVSQIDQYGWWSLWEWSVKGGENAWIGLAALREYTQYQDGWALDFARQRANFLLSLQDSDGALRMGPKGQYFPFPLDDGWWAIKSTENNESALYFLDQMYLVTKDYRYKRAADKIYNWLMETMFDSQAGLFHRGEAYSAGAWRIDSLEMYSPDTLTCAPVERMLKDTRLGTTTLDRLNRITRMMAEAEKKIGVSSYGQLKGLSFSTETRDQGVVSPEWTSQYILFCNGIAEYDRREGLLDEAQKMSAKSRSLLRELKSWYALNDNLLPYALYVDTGLPAESIPTGHGWDTPDSHAALASTIYYGFAENAFDPLRDLIPH
ncbi:MAG: hypothetical protein HQL15_10055 [Candidatus Omnitrophica bacterium]|nr:hypothetical protein [Candidatus Omnitrophota bacterium]